MRCNYFICKCITLLLILTTVSCASTKKTVYFQGVGNTSQKGSEILMKKYEAKISPNDNLLITVAVADNPDAALPYNNIDVNRNININNIALQGYIVDKNGDINFPVLGSVRVGGLTKHEAINMLREKIAEKVVDPIVNIRFLNYKITILGEVARPGTYTITDERISLPEALGLAGDMTIYGKRQNVLISRESENGKVFTRLDMTSPDVFTSPYYYLQQNDIVYVEPNKARSGVSSYNQNLPFYMSIVSTMITIIALVIR